MHDGEDYGNFLHKHEIRNKGGICFGYGQYITRFHFTT